MTEYKWTIASLEVKRQADSLTDIVARVYWVYHAIDGVDKVGVNGSTPLPPADSANFIPFPSLSETQIITWLEQTEDISQLHIKLSELMQEAKAQDTYILPNIWQQTAQG